MGCSSRIAQILLFVFNFIFVVAGLALLILGVITKLGLDGIVPEDFSAAVATAPILLIIVGCIVFVVAFLGCCGAMKKSKCMLIMYAVIIICIIIVQIVAGAYALTTIEEGSDGLKDEITSLYTKAFKQYGIKEVYTEYINTVQELLECCGITGHSDWLGPPPASCHEDKDMAKPLFPKGCTSLIFDTIVELSDTIGKVALGLCATELLTVVFAVCLLCSI